MTSKFRFKIFSFVTGIKYNVYHPLVWITGSPSISSDVYIGGFSEINAKDANIVIESGCDIASFVSINCADSHKKTLKLENFIERNDIWIERNVFIGSHSVIKGGVRIGHNSVVASGTIVDSGIYPPFSLIFGNPTQVKNGYYRKKYDKS
jgi:acetyltransferase-like isoleucine patch superfamily enzyme